MTAAYASDILDRVTNITYRTAGGGTLRSFTYSYDVSSLITQQVVTADGACVTNAYAYDGLGRLVAESRIQETGVGSESYTYDLAGNRLSVSSEFSVVNNTYTNNRLTAASDDTALAYDAAGNVTSIVSVSSVPSVRELVWNAQRQLVSVSTNGVFAESYAYDAIGRRISTTDSSGTTYHVYDGDECVADVDTSGNPLRSYTWGPGIDNLLAVTVYASGATNSYYAVKDHLGSVHALVDESGNTALTVSYDSWGNLLSHFSTLELSNFRFLFQGREYSFATGLYNFRARWYEPRLGRWLSNDPIGISGGLNLYEFCGNDPVNYRDPWGEDSARIKIDGYPITVHRNDPDKIWPSDPHGHINKTRLEIDNNGNIWNKTTRQQVGKLSKKGIGRWVPFIRKIAEQAGKTSVVIISVILTPTEGGSQELPWSITEIPVCPRPPNPFIDPMFPPWNPIPQPPATCDEN